MCISDPEERMLFWNDPNERPPTPLMHEEDKPQTSISPHQLHQEKEPPTEEEISSLQTIATALIDKIQTTRQNQTPSKLNPEAPTFDPETKELNSPKEPTSTSKAIIKIKAQIHAPMEWENYYSHTYTDQGQIKHALKTRIVKVTDQESLNQITPLNTELDENHTVIEQEIPNPITSILKKPTETFSVLPKPSKDQPQRVRKLKGLESPKVQEYQ